MTAWLGLHKYGLNTKRCISKRCLAIAFHPKDGREMVNAVRLALHSEDGTATFKISEETYQKIKHLE